MMMVPKDRDENMSAAQWSPDPVACDRISGRSGLLSRPRIKLFAMGAAVLVLLALSMLRTYSLGQHQRMYDNPVFRWRESLAIALSRMQTPPLQGYLAYGSIRDYLAMHGCTGGR
jgi:hypothetical protein